MNKLFEFNKYNEIKLVQNETKNNNKRKEY